MVRPLAIEQAHARAVLRDTLLTEAEHDAVVDATPRGAPLRPGQTRPNGPRRSRRAARGSGDLLSPLVESLTSLVSARPPEPEVRIVPVPFGGGGRMLT